MKEVKELQEKILEIYLVFKKICEDNNFRYFAIGGTCLGAVRHKGFIPWDDDMDIAMPRSDYEKFKKMIYPKSYTLYDEYSGEHNENFFSKFHDINTTYIQKTSIKFSDRDTGVFIDVMPLDSLPNEKIKQKFFTKKLEILHGLNRSQKDFYGVPRIYKIFRPIIKLLPLNIFRNQFLKSVKKYDFDNSKLLYTGMLWSYRSHKFVFMKEWFINGIEVPFENTTIPIPSEYNLYLTNHFGDYMTIPANKEERSHNALIMLTIGYKEYRNTYLTK